MKMLPLLAIVGTVAMAGCTSSEPKSTATSPMPSSYSAPVAAKSPDVTPPMVKASPMAVDGTTVSYDETATGACLHFRSSGNIVALRTRVDAMAEKHNANLNSGSLPASTASSLSADDGARLVFLPNDTKDLQTLRSHLRKHANMMAAGDSPMMSMP